MDSNRRLIAYIRRCIGPVIDYNKDMALVELDVKLETLDKLLAYLPCYERDAAFDAICGKEIPTTTEGAGNEP